MGKGSRAYMRFELAQIGHLQHFMHLGGAERTVDGA